MRLAVVQKQKEKKLIGLILAGIPEKVAANKHKCLKGPVACVQARMF